MEMMLDIWLWLHLRWRYQITETQYCVFAAILAINAIPMWKQLPDWLLLSKVFTGTLPVMEGDRDNQGPMKLEDCYRYFVYYANKITVVHTGYNFRNLLFNCGSPCSSPYGSPCMVVHARGLHARGSPHTFGSPPEARIRVANVVAHQDELLTQWRYI